VLGKLEGKYAIDTDTKLLLDGNPVRSLKDIPAGATIVEAAILGGRVTRLAFESPAK
jgi:hypothetical protein